MPIPSQKPKNTDLRTCSGQTRQRLLAAAEKLFADRGFDSTSVRDITTAAGCNIAAVNYHFQGKDKLYFEVFGGRLAMLRDVRVRSIEQVISRDDRSPTLEELLGAFTSSFLEPLVDQAHGRQLLKLMLREMLDPHLPKGMFFEETILPVMTAMLDAMAKVCPGLGRGEAVLSVKSIVAQLLHAVSTQEMFDRREEAALLMSDSIRTIEHIIAFSAAGIRAYENAGEVKDSI